MHQELSSQIEAEVTSWPGVTIGDTGRGGLQFNYGKVELDTCMARVARTCRSRRRSAMSSCAAYGLGASTTAPTRAGCGGRWLAPLIHES